MKKCFIINVVMTFTFLSTGLGSVVWGGEIYRFIDSKGQVHFTDRPPAGYSSKLVNPRASNAIKIYKFVDPQGVVHLTDRPEDARYQLIYQGSATIQPFSGGTYSALEAINRRFTIYEGLVQEAAARTGVEAALIHAVIQAESAYNPYAVSPKGATGLMQLMPGTAARYGVIDRTDASANVYGGAQYLSDLLRMFQYNKELAVAAYNAGENAVIRYGYQIPPYRETRNYVRTVMGIYNSHTR